MEIVVKYFSIRKSILFLIIMSGYILISWASRFMLINEVVFYNTYSEQITWDRSMALFENAKRLFWISYAFIPVSILIKFTLITTVVYAGLFILGKSDSVDFGELFGVVSASEIIFLAAALMKILWFYFFAGDYNLNDLNFFYPLSLSNFFDYSEVDRIWIFPLQILNVFQILYILVLSLGIKIKLELPGSVTEKAVLISYLPGLIIITALFMFLTIGEVS